MNTTSTPYPALVIINVEYLHSFDATYEPEPVKISLRHSDIFPYPVRPETCEEVLEVIFRQLNHVDGTELCSQPEFKRCRSMSVGDVVTFRGPGGFRKTYVCEGCGWAEISRDEAQWLVENISPRDFWGTFAKTVEKGQALREAQLEAGIKLPPVKVRKAHAPVTKIVRPRKGGGYRRSDFKRHA